MIFSTNLISRYDENAIVYVVSCATFILENVSSQYQTGGLLYNNLKLRGVYHTKISNMIYSLLPQNCHTAIH
jgi:hypothetical protein